jgi:hypothetical protein
MHLIAQEKKKQRPIQPSYQQRVLRTLLSHTIKSNLIWSLVLLSSHLMPPTSFLHVPSLLHFCTFPTLSHYFFKPSNSCWLSNSSLSSISISAVRLDLLITFNPYHSAFNFTLILEFLNYVNLGRLCTEWFEKFYLFKIGHITKTSKKKKNHFKK